MGARNRVIAGDYEGYVVRVAFGGNGVQFAAGLSYYFDIDKSNIESYELVDEQQRKSAVSGITRGAVGAALLGPVGMLAGLSAKSKGTYTVILYFKDGKKSLIEIDNAVYKVLIRKLF